MEPRYTNAALYKYHMVALKVSMETFCPIVDSWALFNGQESAPNPNLFRDGLHFSAFGNRLVFSGLYGAIVEHYPELEPEKLKVTWL
jgi:lysophospholipase L1-like esterase